VEILKVIAYNKIEVNTLIDYKPLLDYCYNHKIKLTNVVVECGLSKGLVTQINNNKNIEIKALERICLRLGIPVQDVVRFVED
jgi:DNA-binding Xre family transcriptional regulator